jgi:hypothetical protein
MNTEANSNSTWSNDEIKKLVSDENGILGAHIFIIK